jgi:hypothetical protein
LNYLGQFVKPGGQIGIAGAGLVAEMTSPVPEHLQADWTQDFWAMHSAEWWRRHWERTGIVEIELADSMPDGWKLWSHWQRTAWPHNTSEIEMIERDAGRWFTYIRVVGRRRVGAILQDYCWPDTLRCMPSQFEKTTMMRE